MIRSYPRSTRSDTLFPYTTLFRSLAGLGTADLHFGARVGLRVEIVVETDHAVHIGAAEVERLRDQLLALGIDAAELMLHFVEDGRSEEHTSELQSLMRISYAVFCLKQNITNITQ